jgi:putative phosphoesterase
MSYRTCITRKESILRVAAVSDIHVSHDGSDDTLLHEIKKRVEELAPDMFVIAGDISAKIDLLSDSLSKLAVDNCVNLFVAGNHDIWFEQGEGLDSLEKYSHTIGNVCKKQGWIHLPDQPYEIDNIAFLGSLGWSDYSFRRSDLEIPEEAYEQKQYKDAVWYDVFNVDWHFTDKEATDLFNRKIEYDLSTITNHVDRIVFVSHHLPFRELTLYKQRLPWDFFSAYMGATSTGEILLDDERVFLTVSGHSHVRSKIMINGITAVTVPIGYGRPELNDIPEFVKSAIADIIIEDRHISLPDFVEGDICAGLPYVVTR